MRTVPIEDFLNRLASVQSVQEMQNEEERKSSMMQKQSMGAIATKVMQHFKQTEVSEKTLGGGS